MQGALRTREEQVSGLEEMLARTVEVKLEYEEVIRQLLMHEGIRDYVVEICKLNREMRGQDWSGNSNEEESDLSMS